MKLTRLSLDDLAEATHAYAMCEVSGESVLVICFACRVWDRGAATRLAACIAAGLEAWAPDGLILDLSEVEYSWGDEMQEAIETPWRWAAGRYPDEGEFPLAIIVSDKCASGLSSLVEEEMGRPRGEILTTSLELAAEVIVGKLAATRP